jgi:DUF3016 family protein
VAPVVRAGIFRAARRSNEGVVSESAAMSIRNEVAGLGLILFLAPMAQAVAEVTVDFVDPAHYTDPGNNRYDAEHDLQVLQGHLVKLGDRCLAEGERLELQVLNVDLAGRPEWWHAAGYDLRVMRDISWPRVDLAYVWRDGTGKLRAQGRERIIDQGYLSRSAYLSTDTDELPYEKAMLRDWFERTLCRKGS